MKWLLALLVIWLVWRYLPRPRKAALAILALPPGADAEAIRQAHRRLVGQVHPDRGGSADLTRRVNAARNLLLDRRNG